MTLRHKDPTLRHNNPSLRHKDPTLRHNDVSLRHNKGAAAGAAHVKTTSASATNNPSSATHNLNGGSGSNRLIVAIVTGQDDSVGSLGTISLGGNPGTILGDFATTSAGNRAVNLSVAYWLDVDHPGSGDQTLSWSYPGGSGSSRSAVLEFDGVDQSSPISAVDNQVAHGITADNLNLAVSISDEAGGLGVLALAGVEVSNNSLTGLNQVHACSNTDSKEDDETQFSTGRGVWLDDDVADAAESYNFTASSDGTTGLEWTGIAFALRGA